MLNKVQLIGNLGRDPEVKATNGGESVATFNVATSERWKGKDGQMQEATEWHNVVVWGKLAGICGDYLNKGMKVYIEGRLKQRKYTGKDGVEKYVTEIICNEMKMLDKPVAGASKADRKVADEVKSVFGSSDPCPF